MGIKKTFEKAKLSPFYWQDMKKTVRRYVDQCDICGERKNPLYKKRHCMKSYVVGAPFERVASDIAGPFPVSEKKNRYILIVGDYFSKLTESYAIPDIKAETVANTIFRAWIKRYGCPREIHSDQGKQYESALFKELCKMLEINKTRTTPLHPRSDGMIERMNRSVNDMLSKYIKSNQKDWDDYLDFITMAYNSTPHESTGVSPYKLIYGREMSFPIDILTEKHEEITLEPIYSSKYVQDLEEQLRKAHELARNQLKISAERQRTTYNLNVRKMAYEVGDLVWRNQKKHVPGLKMKIARHWTGPWVIIEKLNEVIFKIQHSQNSSPVIIHGDNLKTYRGDKKLKWFKPNDENLTIEFPDISEFQDADGQEKTVQDDNQEGMLPEQTNSDNEPVDEEKENISNPDINCPVYFPDGVDGDSEAVSKSSNELCKKNKNVGHNRSPGLYRTPGRVLRKNMRGKMAQSLSKQQQQQTRHDDKEKYTRFGRKIVKPLKFLDFIHHIYMENKEKDKQIICEHCGQKYTTKRNLKRHVNQVHSAQVKFVRCPKTKCRKTFLRKEYMTSHLEGVHHMDSIEAKQIVKVTKSGMMSRSDLMKPGACDTQEVKLDEEPSSTGAPNLCFHMEDYLEIYADSSEFDMEFIDSVDFKFDESDKKIIDELVEDILEMSDTHTEGLQDGVDNQIAGPSGLNLEAPSNKNTEEDDDAILISDTDSAISDHEVIEPIEGEEKVTETIKLKITSVKSYRNGVLVKEKNSHIVKTSCDTDSASVDVRDFVRKITDTVNAYTDKEIKSETFENLDADDEEEQ